MTFEVFSNLNDSEFMKLCIWKCEVITFKNMMQSGYFVCYLAKNLKLDCNRKCVLLKEVQLTGNCKTGPALISV